MNENKDTKNEISIDMEINTENTKKETVEAPAPEEQKPETAEAPAPKEQKPETAEAPAPEEQKTETVEAPAPKEQKTQKKEKPIQPSCKKEKKYCFGDSGKPCFYKKVLLALVLFAGCGLSAYVGGRIAGKEIKDELREELADSSGSQSYSDALPYGFMDRYGNYGEDKSSGNGYSSGPQSGLDGNSSATQENEESAALGITVQQMTGSENSGVVISGFADNSYGEQAGLAKGDEIVSLDGTKVSSLQEIHDYLKQKKVGDTVKVTVSRNGEEVSADVTLIESN